MKSPNDSNNKIKHSKLVYECQECGKQFEYLSQAKDHERDLGRRVNVPGGNVNISTHKPTTVSREGTELHGEEE